MGEPHAIVLVPTEAGVALRQTGRCGSSPPMVHCHRDGSWSSRGDWCDTVESGVPLWWDGALVPEAWDRYVRVLLATLDPSLIEPDDYPVSRWPTVDGVLGSVSVATDRGFCRVVLS